MCFLAIEQKSAYTPNYSPKRPGRCYSSTLQHMPGGVIRPIVRYALCEPFHAFSTMTLIRPHTPLPFNALITMATLLQRFTTSISNPGNYRTKLLSSLFPAHNQKCFCNTRSQHRPCKPLLSATMGILQFLTRCM